MAFWVRRRLLSVGLHLCTAMVWTDGELVASGLEHLVTSIGQPDYKFGKSNILLGKRGSLLTLPFSLPLGFVAVDGAMLEVHKQVQQTKPAERRDAQERT